MKENNTLNFNRSMKLGLAVLVAFTLLAAVLVLVGSFQANPVSADTVPTPVYVSGSSDALNVTFWSDEAVAASGASSAYQLSRYEYLEVQYNIDQPTTVNTTTIKMEWSNDPLCVTTPASAVWSDGPDVVASNAADADSMVQVGNLGRCTRVYATVTNTESVTIDVWALAK